MIRKFLTKSSTLWISFIAWMVMSLVFVWVMWRWGFIIIDEIYQPEVLQAHLDEMSDKQKSVHAIMTGTLDVAYPFAYGVFFMGMSLRFLGKWGPWLALPALLCIPVDLIEGVIQILLLNGNESLIGAKAIVTQLKYILFLAALAISLVALGIAIKKRFSSNKVR